MKDKIRSGLTLGIYALLSVALIGVTKAVEKKLGGRE